MIIRLRLAGQKLTYGLVGDDHAKKIEIKQVSKEKLAQIILKIGKFSWFDEKSAETYRKLK
jgi:hypothetical protein